MKLLAIVGLTVLSLALSPKGEARYSSRGRSGVASHEIKSPSSRTHNGRSTGKKTLYYQGQKPRTSRHPSPKHQDLNYAQWGGNSPQD